MDDIVCCPFCFHGFRVVVKRILCKGKKMAGHYWQDLDSLLFLKTSSLCMQKVRKKINRSLYLQCNTHQNKNQIYD